MADKPIIIAPVNDAVIRKALSWSRPDFEDAVQMAVAMHAGANYLTRARFHLRPRIAG